MHYQCTTEHPRLQVNQQISLQKNKGFPPCFLMMMVMMVAVMMVMTVIGDMQLTVHFRANLICPLTLHC